MLSKLRQIRQSRGLTLAEVASRCQPPTTAVTVGRLETGTRQLTLPWINRLADALQIQPQDLLPEADSQSVPVAAQLTADGARPLAKPMLLPVLAPTPRMIGLIVRDSQGDYRAGDQLWLQQLPPEDFADAVNADILVPRSVGRFSFGRLAAIDGNRLHLLPVQSGSRQQIIAGAPWIGRLHLLIRHFQS